MAIRELVTWFLTITPCRQPPSSMPAFRPACWRSKVGVVVSDVVSGCLNRLTNYWSELVIRL